MEKELLPVAPKTINDLSFYKTRREDLMSD
jgi:hypothetical protein